MGIVTVPWTYDDTTGTRTGKSGWKFVPKENFSITSITKSATSDATTGYLLASDKSILGSKAYTGSVATFDTSVACISGTSYYCASDKDGAACTHHYANVTTQLGSFPYSGTKVDYTAGLNSMDDSTTHCFDILIYTLGSTTGFMTSKRMW